MADLLELGRRGLREELTLQARTARTSSDWTAATALELACAWLLAADPRQADLAFLEADQLDPSLALVPDVWGLWPPPPAADSPQRQGALERAGTFRAWRWPDAQALWHTLLPRLQADWHEVLEPGTADSLLILGRSSAASAVPLDPPLEPALVVLVSDAEIAAEPAASSRFWHLVATIRPNWDLARIRAADLALGRGDIEASGRWLADPPAEVLANPWFHDVAARHAVQRGVVDAALDAWSEAIRTAQSQADTAPFVDIFERRRREARRGPGVLQVRAMIQRGESEAASVLLERLLADDPQWQPLRSLREQLRQPDPTTPLERPPLSALLDRAAARLQALGHPLPATSSQIPPPGTTEGEAAMADLEAFSRRLSDYEARFALA